jgi:hypothetical protein
MFLRVAVVTSALIATTNVSATSIKEPLTFKDPLGGIATIYYVCCPDFASIKRSERRGELYVDDCGVDAPKPDLKDWKITQIQINC